jgi:hypothetical protein
VGSRAVLDAVMRRTKITTPSRVLLGRDAALLCTTAAIFRVKCRFRQHYTTSYPEDVDKNLYRRENLESFMLFVCMGVNRVVPYLEGKNINYKGLKGKS